MTDVTMQYLEKAVNALWHAAAISGKHNGPHKQRFLDLFIQLGYLEAALRSGKENIDTETMTEISSGIMDAYELAIENVNPFEKK